MKGAMAEPFVRTIRPPNIAITMKTGSSQYFFRTRKKFQNSLKKVNMCSELILEGFGSGAWWFAQDPIALCCRFKTPP